MTKHGKGRRDLILSVMDDFDDEYGHPPSVRQIMARVGLASTSAVHHHLRRLLQAGLVAECECGCGTYRLVYQDAESGPGFARFTAKDSPADVERKMADAFGPVAGIVDAFQRYMGE